MNTIRAVVIDDEENSRRIIKKLILEHCPELTVVGEADSALSARQVVDTQKPDVVLLDITMPNQSGFDFLDFYKDRPFSVVFVTAFHEHALRAIKASAVDYVLKPIDIPELQQAVQKLVNISREKSTREGRGVTSIEHTEILLENLRSGGDFQKVILHRPRGLKVVKLSDVLYIKSDSHYTTVHLLSRDAVIVTGTLKEYEEMLSSVTFCRIHKSYLVNLMHITEYNYSSQAYALLSNGERVSISKRRIRDFLAKLDEFVSITDSSRK